MFYLLVILLITLGDQALKFYIVHSLGMYQQKTIIDHFFYLHCIPNQGVALGLFSGHRVVVLAVTILIMMAAIFFILIRRKKESRLFLLTLSMIVGGGLGNLIDRVRMGYVVDYLDFRIWPYIFNFADICVVVGCFCLMLILLFGMKKESSHE